MTILVKKLSTFCKTSSGGTPSRSNNAFFENGTIPWVKSGELKNRYITNVEEYITDIAVEKSSAKLVSKGSLLIAMYGATVGEVSQLTFDATTNQAICSILPDQKVCDVNYLYRFLEASKPYLLTRRVGGGQPNISQAVIKDLEVPLPPLNEQRRIASILEKADELRQKRQQAIEKLDQLLQATFIDMFGDPVSNPKGWDKVKFENEVEFLTGFAFKSADFKDSGIKLCRGINILPNTLDWNDTAYWNIEELEKYARFKILQNDILVAMDRPWISTGFKITLVKENDPHMLLVQRVARLRVKESFGANFLFQILSMPEFKKHCRITETTVPHISPTDFKSFELIKPDNHLIEKFEKIAKLIHSQKAKMWNSSLEYKNLFDSLQNQAFSGTL